MTVELRRPFLFAALGLAALVVLVELGGLALLRGPAGGEDDFAARLQTTVAEQRPDLSPAERDAEVARVSAEAGRFRDEGSPGLGIPTLALLDAVVLLTVALLGLALVLPGRVQSTSQGVATTAAAVVLMILAVVAIVATIARLVVMLTLLFSPPFGTIAYVARFGFFDRDGAAIGLSLLLVLKLAAVVCLVVAQPRMVQNRGLVALAATSLLANLLVSLLHGLVPGVLVSITDAIAALVVAAVAVVWLAVVFVGGLRSLARARRTVATA